MIPAGYNIRSIAKPDWLKAPQITEVFSAGGVANREFAVYSMFWKQNGFFMYDSADLVKRLAQSIDFDLKHHALFYYEVYEQELVDAPSNWRTIQPQAEIATNVKRPVHHQIHGYDIVEFTMGTNPECSPLTSCNLVNVFKTNQYALFDDFDIGRDALLTGAFHGKEPGPYRILSVSLIENF
jgi:hypothetical protein